MTDRQKFIVLMLAVSVGWLVVHLLGYSGSAGFGFCLGCAWTAWLSPFSDSRKPTIRKLAGEKHD